MDISPIQAYRISDFVLYLVGFITAEVQSGDPSPVGCT
jgi:hypothetical protein